MGLGRVRPRRADDKYHSRMVTRAPGSYARLAAVFALTVACCLGAGGPGAHASVRHGRIAASVSSPTCRIVEATCRYDLSRRRTQTIANALARYEHSSTVVISAAAAIACLPVAGIGSLICGAAATAAGGYFVKEVELAAAQGACLSLHYKLVRIPFIKKARVIALPDVGVDDGPACHNV